MAKGKRALSLTLLVNKETNRVVFAECDRDFVDILFSFLTLPLGTVIRLLGKQSSLGSMDRLYASVEELDAQYLQTAACKSMLLQPRSDAEIMCEDLMVAIDDLNPRRLFRCPKWECVTKTHRIFSSVDGVHCRCGELMVGTLKWTKKKVDASRDGVFMKGASSFIIGEDLRVVPFSTQASLSLYLKHEIKNSKSIEKKTVDVGKDEILRLLRASLFSKRPLTEAFLLKNATIHEDDDASASEFIDAKDVGALDTKVVKVKLMEAGSKLLYAEGEGDFANLLFSFLTFPLGTILKQLNKRSSLGCLDILYESVEDLYVSTGTNYIKSNECKDKLLAPKLPAYFGCCDQTIRIDEKEVPKCSIFKCRTCFDAKDPFHSISWNCEHGIGEVTLVEVNPKQPNQGSAEYGGAFVISSNKFMVTNEMVVTPLSLISSFDIINKLDLPFGALIEREITIGETEALKLLKACLVSSSALSYAFSNERRSKRIRRK